MIEEERGIARIEAMLDLGRHSDAEALARQGLAHKPDSALLHHLLGRALMSQGDAASAVEPARAAIRLEPESAENLHLLAAALGESGQGPEAQEVALRAVELAPYDWMSHLTLAHVLTFGIGGRKALIAAEAAAHRAVSLAPSHPDTHTLFGIIRWRQDDMATAETAFRNALSIDPTNADAQRNLAGLQIGGVDLVAGAETLTHGLAAYPQDTGMHDELGHAHWRVLSSTTLWLVLWSLVVGGFVLATDFLLRQRAFYGGVMCLMAAALVVKLVRKLPAGTWRLMLPWRANAGHHRRAWIAWCMNVLVALIWFMPARFAVPGWFLLALVTGVVVINFFLRLLIDDSDPSPTRSTGR